MESEAIVLGIPESLRPGGLLALDSTIFLAVLEAMIRKTPYDLEGNNPRVEALDALYEKAYAKPLTPQEKADARAAEIASFMPDDFRL